MVGLLREGAPRGGSDGGDPAPRPSAGLSGCRRVPGALEVVAAPALRADAARCCATAAAAALFLPPGPEPVTSPSQPRLPNRRHLCAPARPPAAQTRAGPAAGARSSGARTRGGRLPSSRVTPAPTARGGSSRPWLAGGLAGDNSLTPRKHPSPHLSPPGSFRARIFQGCALKMHNWS